MPVHVFLHSVYHAASQQIVICASASMLILYSPTVADTIVLRLLKCTPPLHRAETNKAELIAIFEILILWRERMWRGKVQMGVVIISFCMFMLSGGPGTCFTFLSRPELACCWNIECS
jgi:hypothetical protein